MAESVSVPALSAPSAALEISRRHSALVRITHWVNAVSFIASLVSGIAIVLAHPRLYWGETGAVGGPSLIDLPLPFVLDISIINLRGLGRYLHFLSAWVCVLTGLLYIVSGVITRHFWRELLPSKSHLAWDSLAHTVSNHLHFRRPPEGEALSYNVLQRLAYLTVVFILFPLMIWTGLAMSPALSSVFPWLRTVFGGQQSARTIHFFIAVSLVIFLLVHIVMVIRAGFRARMRAMITGQSSTSGMMK
jgi:thiosulfate reductase cytochrome b subunit